MEQNHGLLIVLSGPSGAGKGTLCQELLRQLPQVKYSVSATTRQPRPGEVDGLHYYFRSREEFQTMIEQDQLLEWAEFCGNYYGTPQFAVEQAIQAGNDVILEIEIQGALQVKQRFPQGVFIFVVPPSMDELSQRIHKRGTESEEVIQKRLQTAARELEYVSEYDYVVVNDEIPLAVDKLKSILLAEKCRVKRKPYVFQGV
ncbi:guanylate kinase [Desulfitobacterium sp. LBE]|uniref:Guanylate kinase n=2 Tax=Desulfitobacterium hafniense TaxID=49338 RepID=A0A0W1JE02_DESHA|nr:MULTISPECIES: guanylate kinase [Desulfitobacterium]ACL21910.1 Guanylate kinase [Desulfitobacterium hafniense DCB-2]KTE90081.1 guanylate kinase [Desulfitobacterium hafniense]TWH60312.1 guanylate kinase [Desulfitobacterium sp. LBE]